MLLFLQEWEVLPSNLLNILFNSICNNPASVTWKRQPVLLTRTSSFTVNPKVKPDWWYFMKILAFQGAEEFEAKAPVFVKLFHSACTGE